MAIVRYQVFISSTKKDLSDSRDAVTAEALKLGFIPVGMENFSATRERGWKTIQNTIDQSDYYIVIVGGMYGSIDEDTGLSWTEREYDYALTKSDMPVMAFIQDWDSLTGGNIDEDQKRVKAFREKLKKAHHVETWKNNDDLRARVGAALSKDVRETEGEGRARPGWYRGPAPDLKEFARLSAEANDMRAQLAAMPKQNEALEILKKLPMHTRIIAQPPTSAQPEICTYEGLDLDRNAVLLHAEGNASRPRTYPIAMMATIYGLPDGSWRIVNR